eukprot:GHVU01050389.1.p1 GENE.GHVU01050389.1~~GHVU01050389.1.p1  ORF type:complete len:318 (+),score=49.39 GHVU01050389.1:3-956(+)
MTQNARLVKRLDAWTFNGVLFRNLEWDRRQGGCSAEVSFFHNMLKEFKCDNQPNEMRKLWNNWKLYWERNASLLQQGALVAFVNDEDDIVFFAGVAQGNAPPRRCPDIELPRQKGHVALATVKLDFPTAADWAKMMEVVTEGAPLRMAQMPVSYFAYVHVLTKLQHLPRLPSDLEKQIINPGHQGGRPDYGPQLEAAVEQIQQLTDARQSISHLLEDSGESLLASPYDGASGTERLKVKNLVLDGAQSKAVKSALENPIGIVQGPPGRHAPVRHSRPALPAHTHELPTLRMHTCAPKQAVTSPSPPKRFLGRVAFLS